MGFNFCKYGRRWLKDDEVRKVISELNEREKEECLMLGVKYRVFNSGYNKEIRELMKSDVVKELLRELREKS